MRRTLSAIFIAASVLSGPASADKFKASILPKAEEAKWVAAVKALKTADGSTVGETIAFVSKMLHAC